MNTKLLLVASSLLMAINYVNVVQAMEDNYDENNQAQAKTKLDLLKQDMDNKINELVKELKFVDFNNGIKNINMVTDLCANTKGMPERMLSVEYMGSDDMGNDILESFLDYILDNEITKDKSAIRMLKHKINYVVKNNPDDYDEMYFYDALHEIVMKKLTIKDLEKHPEKNNNEEYFNYKKPQVYSDKNNKIEEQMNNIHNKIEKLSNELSNYIQKKGKYFDIGQVLLFIQRHRNIISDYYNHKNEIKSYAKQYEFNNLLENKNIVNYMQEIAKLHCEYYKLLPDEE